MGKVIRGLIIIFLLIFLQLALLFGTVHESFLDKNAYINLLEERNGYAKIREMIAGQLGEQGFSGQEIGGPGAELLGEFLTDELLKEKIDPLIENFFDYLNGRTDSLNLTIDTGIEKEGLLQNRELIKGLVEQQMAELPACGATEFPELDDTGMPSCIPEGFTADELIDLAIEGGYLDSPEADSLFASQSINLGEEMGLTDDLEPIRGLVLLLSKFILLLWVLVGLCIALLVLASRNSLEKLPKSLGVVLVVSGVIGLVVGFLLGGVIEGIVGGMTPGEGIADQGSELMAKAISALAQQFTANLLFKQFMVIVIGGALIASSFVLKSMKKNQLPKPKPIAKPKPAAPKPIQKPVLQKPVQKVEIIKPIEETKPTIKPKPKPKPKPAAKTGKKAGK